MIDMSLFLNSLRDVDMTTNFRAKLANRLSFVMLAFRADRDITTRIFKILNSNTLVTFCGNFMKIGPVTPRRLRG